MWNNIKNTHNWIYSNIPKFLRKLSIDLNYNSESSIYQIPYQKYINNKGKYNCYSIF